MVALKQAIKFRCLFARERIRTNGDLRLDREESLSGRWGAGIARPRKLNIATD